MFNFGDWVLYRKGDCEQIGRVASVSERGNAFVCFHAGCTAACTPVDMLEPYTGPLDDTSITIGYHRFDEFCPDYDEECCYMCKARKQVQ